MSYPNSTARLAVIALLAAASFTAHAQRPDCPMRDAPMPTRPPGPPPDFVPPVAFPSTFGGEVKVESGGIGVLPPPPDLIEAEEGHLTDFVGRARLARADPPPPDVLAEIAEAAKTPLSSWRFEGYMPNESWKRPRCDAQGNCTTSSRHNVQRVFTRDGSTVVLEEWNMAADGAGIVASAPPNVTIGRLPGRAGGLISPSGCVAASVSWHGEGYSYSVRAVGPMSLQQQRELLLEVANAVERAARRARR